MLLIRLVQKIKNRQFLRQYYGNDTKTSQGVVHLMNILTINSDEKKEPFFFFIDDTLSTKQIPSKNIQRMKFNYSHVSNINEWSYCMVSLLGHSNGLFLPLDFKTYLS